MQTALAPVPISEIVPVPGTDGREAFAVGHSYGTIAAGTIFLRWTAEGGWRSEGNARDELTGQPVSSLGIGALDVTASGAAWASPTIGGFVRREAGGRWISTQPPAGSPTLNGISLGEDDAGVYGFAVGERGAIYRLSSGVWVSESLPGGGANAGVLPTFVDVVAIDRDRAIAVGSSGSPAKLDIRERTDAGAWVPMLSGQPMFDQPPAPTQATSDVATVNRSAQASAVAHAEGITWIAGVIQPVDPQRVIGGGVNRPFVIRLTSEGAFTSFCPAQYRVSEEGATAIDICDKRLPYTVGILSDIDAVGTDVIAGGTGLLRLRAGRWERLPSGVGTIQRVHFAAPDEGWITPNPSISLQRTLSANSSVVGHWTRAPSPSALERWPHHASDPLVAVAAHPSDDRAAMAVGQRGSIVAMRTDLGVERMASPTREHLHAVTWPRGDLAFAVGSNGTILRFDGVRWFADPTAIGLTTEMLRWVTADRSGQAIAVGDAGTILTFDGSAWRHDVASGTLTDETLHAAALLIDGTEVIAGEGPTTVFERTRNGSWRRAMLSVPTYEETVYSAAVATPDGGALLVGNIGFMASRDRYGVWTNTGLGPLASPIHAVDAAAGTIVAIAGASADASRIDERGTVGEIWGSLMEGPEPWVDRSSWTRRSVQPDLDAPAAHDAILGVALDASGRRGWAVGGFPGNVETFDGQRRGPATTSSVWRIDLDQRPQAAPSSYVASLPERAGVSFAFLSDTACTGDVCGPTLGLGTRADRVMLAALSEIADAGRRNEVSFLGLGGDLRANGIPDDLAAMERLFDELPVPVYAAMGDEDLRPGLTGNPLLPRGELSGSDPTVSNELVRQVFADRPAPWGSRATPRGITAVTVAGSTPADAGARTHYAFDVVDDDGQRIRIAVLDTSQNLTLDLSSQNPPEKQETWLQSLLADARVRGVPVVVLTHEPAVLPRSTRTDAANLTTALTTGASAVVTGGSDGRNLVTSAGVGDVAIPVGTFASGGSPLGAGYEPILGAYHAWARVTVDPAQTDALGRAHTTFDVLPILESVSLELEGGRAITAGSAIDARALGRLFEVGGSNAQRDGDGDEPNASYLRLPFPPVCGSAQQPGPDLRCRPAEVAVPSHRFITSDPTIAAFVARDPNDAAAPLRTLDGALVADDTSGLLCTFAAGEVDVAVEVGLHGARIPIHVSGGAGPCIPGVIVEPVIATDRPPTPVTDAPQPQIERNPPPPLNARPPEVAAAAAVAPPPINPAPAPPAGGAGGRQEEHEAASERANFIARRSAEGPIPGPSALMLLILPAIAFTAARVAHRFDRAPSVAYRTTRRR